MKNNWKEKKMNRRLLLGGVLKYKLPVGFEYEVPYTELTAGQLIRDGSLVNRNTYSELWKFVEAHPSMLVNDDEWLTTLAANEGLVCNYYSTGDNSTTFRLPKAGTIVLPNSDPSKINTYSTDIQRNITGSITMIDTIGKTQNSAGALLFTATNASSSVNNNGNWSNSGTIDFDASRSIGTDHTGNLEDKYYEYLYRPCPGKHFYYEVSKELNIIPDPTTTELSSSSVISPNGQVIPISDILFGNVPGCRVEKLSEHSYQATITFPMPDSVKIDIRCGNEAPPPKSIFFTQGESIDLNDIAEEITEKIDGLEYTFSQPNYLRDMQDPRDIPDPQDVPDSWEHLEPSTEALLGTTLDQLMRYSRLSGYRGDHFVNN